MDEGNLPPVTGRLNGQPLRWLMFAPRVPVAASGTPVILRRLIRQFSADEVVVVARPAEGPHRSGQQPECPTVLMPGLRSGIRGERYFLLASGVIGVLWGLFAVLRFRPRVIVAIYPDEGSLLGGYLLHRITGIPLVTYLVDLYMEEKRTGWQGRLARWLQPRAFSASSRVAAVSRGMSEFYRDRYGLDAAVLPHAVDLTEVLPTPPERASIGPIRIGYSGNINEARLSLLRALTTAVGDDPRFQIHYFGPSNQKALETMGLWRTNVTTEFVAETPALIDRLADCDLLYLPVTFAVDQNSRDSLATCFGTKTIEYLLSGRPILLQSPPGYFINRFFVEKQCGVVVEDPSVESLRSAIATIAGDQHLRQRLAAAAARVAQEFDAARVGAALRDVLQSAAT